MFKSDELRGGKSVANATATFSDTLVCEQGSLVAESAKKNADPFFSGRRHIPELDGLRGLAIILVLICHYCSIVPIDNWLIRVGQVGWVGVNLFFILSGFLITGILYDSKGQQFYFRNFYARRTLRVFPLYFGVLAIELSFLFTGRFFHIIHWTAGNVPRILWSQQVWYWTYTSNIAFSIFHVNPIFQGHFWSLAVEEQFYLIWPIIIFLTPNKRLLLTCFILIGLGALSRFVMTATGLPFYPSIYFFTVPQFEALGFGALIVILSRQFGFGKLGRLLGPGFLITGFIICLSTYFIAGGNLFYSVHSMNSLISSIKLYIPDLFCTGCDIGFTGLLFCAITGGIWSLQEFLQIKILRSVGKYSYGLYVYHYLILGIAQAIGNRIGLTKGGIPQNVPIALGFVTSNLIIALSFAYGSYHLYEKHFLKLKKYFPERVTTVTPQLLKTNEL